MAEAEFPSSSEDPTPAAPERQAGLRRDSVVRLSVDVFGLFTGLAVAVITARVLGPDGKGVVAGLTLLSMLLFRIAAFGLGDSAIVLVGKGQIQPASALRSNVWFTLLSGLIAGAVFVPIAIVMIEPVSDQAWIALIFAAMLVPIGALQDTVSRGLIMVQAIVRSSTAIAVSAMATLLATLVLVSILDFGVPGAVLAVLLGGAMGLLTSWALLPAALRRPPHFDPVYLRKSIGLGLRFEASNLVTIAAGRVDLLIVLVLLGDAAAGRYSVSLTVGTVVALIPIALSYAAFPRIAYSSEKDALHLALRSWRVGAIATLVSGVALGVLTPLVIPIAFGSAFEPAVVPAVVLILGSAALGGQWTLARALAARGRPSMLLGSFALSLAIMVALDLALIPTLGLTGAATASAVSSIVGLTVCARAFLREGAAPGDFFPGTEDVDDVVDLARSVVLKARAAAN